MSSKLKNLLLLPALLVFAASATASLMAAPTTLAAPVNPEPGCNARFITFPAWYNGLVGNKGGEVDDKDRPVNCEIVGPDSLGDPADTQLSRYIWKIVLNVLDIILQIVAYAAVGFVIYGGFKYVSSTGRADKIKEGRELILNAVIGLAISILAATIVGYIGANL